MKTYNIFFNGQKINQGNPLTREQAQHYVNSCIMNSGFAPEMVPVTEPGEETTETEMFKANFKAAVAYVAGELAQDQIEFRGKWLTDNAFAFDGGGISVVLYEKKEAWYDIEDAGLRPLGNVEMFKEQVNEYLARVRK